MHALDMLTYGHQTVVDSVDGLPEAHWERAGVCGHWSVKEIVAHLASYERLLVEILQTLTDSSAPSPLLATMLANEESFNDDQVLQRQHMTPAEQWADYETAHIQAQALLQRIPLEGQRLPGVLSWYGPDYDLEDFLVYMFYAHKREHAAQINVYRDRLAQQAAVPAPLLAGAA